MTTQEPVMRRYTFKLYPNSAQEAELEKQSRMMAQLWNAALHTHEHWFWCGEQIPLLFAFEQQKHRGPDQADSHVREWRSSSQYIAARKARSTYIKNNKIKRITAYTLCKDIKDIRAQSDEWRTLNADTPAQVIFMLDEAFKAFFKRAKRGDGASSGYPKYKRVAKGISIPFREMGKGWRMTPAHEIADKPAMGGFTARQKRGSVKGKSSHNGNTLSHNGVETPRNCGVTERLSRESQRLVRVETPRNWRLYIKGVTGLIKVRGEFPETPVDIRDCMIMKRDEAWWISVAAKMQPRRVSGWDKTTIHFDLIDEFARVERVNGRSPASHKRQITAQSQRRNRRSGADTPDLCGDEKIKTPPTCVAIGADTPDLCGDEKVVLSNSMAAQGADTPDLSVPETMMRRVDEIKSERDLRYRKKSWRWWRETRRAGKLSTRAKRIRSHILHGWTTNMVAMSSDITIITPNVKEQTQSPKGDEREWGANVSTVSELNRKVLNQAPALARQMLSYKAAEAGIRCDIVEDEVPDIAIGEKLVAAGKALRKTKRALERVKLQ